MKRLFTFGCSYTIWSWPTWADYIGVNFDAYYNFARSGSDNKNILYNVLNANEKFNFTKDDTIIVMFTSFNRCSYFKQYELFNSGDLVEQQEQHPFMNKYPYEAGIYDSWLSAKSIKNFLDGKGVNYHLQQALPYDFLWENKKVLKSFINFLSRNFISFQNYSFSTDFLRLIEFTNIAPSFKLI